ncbi:MAG: hypothetical protein MZV63_61245 [Marinilabiliales bacterium]|nr:hypothetical protein [Marinilabiliales bacterium]
MVRRRAAVAAGRLVQGYPQRRDVQEGARPRRSYRRLLCRCNNTGSFLARGDTQNNQEMMGDHQEGFGYISNIAIDQHVLARNRQFDMYGILREHPELLGIGIDENTAVVVQRDTMEVIGASYVLVYDGSFWSREGSDLKIIPEKRFSLLFSEVR